ncbi:hypothetical protein ACFQX4_21115 [Roseomonas sp. GCM10028921]
MSATAAATADAPPAPSLVDQGPAWDPVMRARYHFAPQGSRLMPRDWFLSLDRAGDETLLAAPANLARFGFIYAPNDTGTSLNLDGLPTGFAVDPYASEPDVGRWVGLTCAACHSAEVTYRGARLRIEGSPAALDFDLFGAELNEAVQASARDRAKHDRMTARVAARGGSAAGGNVLVNGLASCWQACAQQGRNGGPRVSFAGISSGCC